MAQSRTFYKLNSSEFGLVVIQPIEIKNVNEK